MKLKTCKNIELVLTIIKKILLIPFLPIAIFAAVFGRIWTTVYDGLDKGVWKISNWMLCNCDEVKNGVIKNQRYKYLSSRSAYIWLKNEIDLK